MVGAEKVYLKNRLVEAEKWRLKSVAWSETSPVISPQRHAT